MAQPNTPAPTTPAALVTSEGIDFYQLAARKAALGLEIKGLRHSSGRSVYALCKRVYNLKGSRASVYKQMQAMINAKLKLN